MSMETFSLRIQMIKGMCLETWGAVTNDPYDEVTGRHLRQEAEMQHSMAVSRQQMLVRRRRSLANIGSH